MVETSQNSAGLNDASALPEDPSCLAVMYHYVSGDDATGRVEFRTAQRAIPGLCDVEFSRQIDLLCETREPIDWPTLYAWMQGKGSIPRRSFLLTFDDGLADHARTVVPILEQRGLRGVFFVPGAILESHRMLPAHALHVLLSRVDETQIEDDIRKLAGGGVGEVPEEEARRMYHYESPARARLKYLITIMLPIEQRSAALADLFERYVGSSERWARHWYLGWDDLARMQTAGHTIGTHATCHEPLTRLSPDARRRDLRRVQALLAEGLGSDLRPISYPYGAYDEDTVAACREIGFAHGFTTQRDLIRPGADALRLPRVDTIHVNALLQKESACLQA